MVKKIRATDGATPVASTPDDRTIPKTEKKRLKCETAFQELKKIQTSHPSLTHMTVKQICKLFGLSNYEFEPFINPDDLPINWDEWKSKKKPSVKKCLMIIKHSQTLMKIN